MTDSLAGTGALVRLALRRDRWLLPEWIAFFVVMAAFSVAATEGLYTTAAERILAADAVNSTPSIVALYGRIDDPASLGGLPLFKLAAFGAALVGVLLAVITVRHTRQEEESGRLELLGSCVVGRGAPLAAALVVAGGAGLVLGAATAAALVAVGLPVAGSIAFGAMWAVVGWCFAGVAAVCAQLTSSARTADALALAVIATAYALRAAGDLGSPSWASWLSPVGWGQKLRPFGDVRPEVLLLPLVFVAAMVVLATVLRSRRDLGRGALPERSGPARGRLGGVEALAWRLHRTLIVACVVAFAAFGVLLGSLANQVEGFASSPAFQQFLQALGGEQALVDAFLAAELGFLGLGASALGIVIALHLRAEEVEGRTDRVLATTVSRVRWATSYVGLACAAVLGLLVVGGSGVALGIGLATGSTDAAGRVLVAALAQVPAAWLMTCLVLLLVGWLPRLAGLVWGVFAAAVVLVELGTLWDLPTWLVDLSPYARTPLLPVSTADVGVLVGLLVVTAAVAVIGMLGWRRRDLHP